jgi:multidrug efflux pump subunit AcrA (membrane-fusion protein)
MKQVSKLFILAALILQGCSKSENTALVYQVKKQSFSIMIPAKGELFAAKATVISAPISSAGRQNIAWLAPEFSQVKKGDLIARFDGEAMTVQSKDKQNELAITEQEILEKNGGLSQEQAAINKDISIVIQEKAFAETFSIDDVNIRSRLEILDSMQNSAYLRAKQEYLFWKDDSFAESSAGDMGLLKMKQQQHQEKIFQLNDSLSRLEVRAPHDGLLIFKANWRGEKPRAGQSLWSGQKIAELPDTSVMKAKLYILESEAIDLAEGKLVTFHLNAHVDKAFSGTVAEVGVFPRSIKRGDPQKFFEVTVKLKQQNSDLFVPGRKIDAKIIVASAQDKLIIPLQSVFTKANQAYVYVYAQGEYLPQNITLGQTNLSHVEVISGLSAGQKISLINMEDKV